MPAIRSRRYRRISFGVSSMEIDALSSGLGHLEHEFDAPQRRTEGITHAWVPLVGARICLGNAKGKARALADRAHLLNHRFGLRRRAQQSSQADVWRARRTVGVVMPRHQYEIIAGGRGGGAGTTWSGD